MKETASTSYLDEIKALFELYNVEDIKKGILSILSGIKSSIYTDASIADHFDLLKKHVTGTRNSQAHITRTNLMQYVNDSLFGLPAERFKEPKNKERLQYVIRHIISSSKQHQEAEESIHEIMAGAFTKDYKLKHSDLFLEAENYRNLYNRLENHATPTKAHLIEILMVLGFDLEVLSQHLQCIANTKKPIKSPSRKAIKMGSIVSLIGVISILGIAIFLIRNVLSNSKEIDMSRPSVHGESLFGSGYPATISSENFGETIIQTDTILFEKYIETPQNIPFNNVWIKIWLVNTSAEHSLYAHSIAIKSGDPAVYAGEIQDDGLKIRASNVALEVNLNCSRQTVYEWTIAHSEPILEPLEKKPIWLHINGNGKCILPYKIFIRVQSNDRRHLVESDRTYFIALD